MRPEWTFQIQEEVETQLKTGFLVVQEYPKWLANIVPVLKKDGGVRMFTFATSTKPVPRMIDLCFLSLLLIARAQPQQNFPNQAFPIYIYDR